jgi:hypothetical protein
MRSLIVVSMCLSLVAIAFAGVDTVWVRRYDGPMHYTDIPEALAIDGTGNVCVTGYTGFISCYDYATIKYSPTGETLWTRTYNGPGNGDDYARAIAADGSGNVYVTGSSFGAGTGDDIATIKYGSSGDTLWLRRYNGPSSNSDAASAMAVDGTGNVYVTGLSHDPYTDDDYTTVKYSPTGEQLWASRYSGPDSGIDHSNAIAVDGAGNVYVTGFSEGAGTGRDYATIKYSPTGQELWVRRYDGPVNGGDAAWAIAVDMEGNASVTGDIEVEGTACWDYLTIKYDPSGETLWTRRYTGPGSGGTAWAVAVDGSANVYVTGDNYESQNINADYATVKYSPTGEELWVRRYNGPGNDLDIAKAIVVDGAGNAYVTGTSDGGGTSWDFATVKYSPDGRELWVIRYDGPAWDMDRANAMALDSSGNVYVTGDSRSAGTDQDYATIKYVQTPGVLEENGPGRPRSSQHCEVRVQNPAHGTARVYYSPSSGQVTTLRVYDVLGGVVYTAKSDNGLFTVGELPAGIYLLRLESNGCHAEQRLVVVR